jgi:hypothetical protein
MARDLASFWHRDSETKAPKGASATAIAAAESQLGVRLPILYRKLVELQDGGILVAESIALPRPSKAGEPVARLLGGLFGVGGPTAYSILCTPGMLEAWEMPPGLVLISGDGHRWFALDYRDCGPNGDPCVVWIDNDSDETISVAATFEEFLDRLHRDAGMPGGDGGIIESESFLDF